MKRKGSAAERELMSMLWGSNFACVRAAGSGSTSFACPDLIASNGSQIFAIECKACAEAKRSIHSNQVNQLIEFSKVFGATPLVAVKINNRGWFFLELADLKPSSRSENLIVNQDVLDKRAKRFSEVIGNCKQARLNEA